MVMSFTNIQVFEGDGLTDRVCNSCIEKLSSAYLFKIQVEKIDCFLREDFVTSNDREGLQKTSTFDYNALINKDIHIHTGYGRIIERDDQNSLKDGNVESKLSDSQSSSDETDTDVASIKCTYCDHSYNSTGVHRCNVTCVVETHSPGSEGTLVAEGMGEDIVQNDFKTENHEIDINVDTVDGHMPLNDVRTHKNVRRKIGWSNENIYQEIVFKNPPKKKVVQTPTSSPFKAMFARLGNESFSTPKKISFRKLIEDGKAKTSNYIPFRRYLENYKQKKRTAEIHKLTKTNLKGVISDSDCGSPSGTSEESWKLKQNLICACDKKIYMLSENLQDRTRICEMITSLGGIVAESTKMEMLATHFISSLPVDACSGMMVCALATGKWLLHSNFVYDSFRSGTFLNEKLYEWIKHPKILELDNTSVEVAKAAVYWHLELTALCAKFPFEGMQIVLIMKKKYRQYYQMIFKTLKAKPMTYDPRMSQETVTGQFPFLLPGTEAVSGGRVELGILSR
ncbi:DNA topoisomerase 2-binding protein 1 [Eumeta japonica]|uniref:DNA topoisomerase 2-binding protein 1 n=1 Tax=Eumeta variegata TaxID=151549 RepID=A0A4C1Z000_EUMVA|nr:DNA topoisomerase 2-binding protein 1 [Eumeta japonica]